MNRSHLWLFILSIPLLIIAALSLFIYFINPQSNTSFRIIMIALIPLVIPTSLILYIIVSKRFLCITRKTISLTIILTFIGSSSLIFWAMLVYSNPQLIKNTFLLHKFIDTVYQDLPHKQYIYSWNKSLNNSENMTMYTARFSEKQETVIKDNEYHIHGPSKLSMKNNFFQPFLKYFLINSKNKIQKSFAFFVSLAIMLSVIYTGISIVSLWTTNIFFQVIFLINAYGILNIVLNLLIPYMWILIAFMALLLIVLLLFMIFRIYYNVDIEKNSNENKLST